MRIVIPDDYQGAMRHLPQESRALANYAGSWFIWSLDTAKLAGTPINIANPEVLADISRKP